PRGEFTLVLAGAPQVGPELSEAEIKTELVNLINQGLSRSQASRQLAQHTSLPRREIYQLALRIDVEQM
ncbi:MAG: rRNA (cytidine-2'-O-)-methyltransferase, partial [Pseudanabaenales cyanobacterium]|nr:rRNA (cytidine-2'-O-)-methyltransferase [Pseudanabaenales cyanobacterium]